MKYVLAVSGGIDSVVLLDMLAHKPPRSLIVAHFDHGIRLDSAWDAKFVQALAQKYHLPFVTKREELGAGASEELARTRRYAFLRSVAEKNGASIVTAHHGDDIVETVAINLIRGTGWRGLAVLDSPAIARPLLQLTKSEIRDYACRRRLEWIEDSTNAENDYLRNRVRGEIARHISSQQKQAVIAIWEQQVKRKATIDTELASYVREDSEYARYLFICTDSMVAGEILRAAIVAKTKLSPTRPQLERALLAIKVARANTTFEIGNGVSLGFTVGTFIVQTP